MSNPAELYNNTDLPGEPKRRLIFCGQNQAENSGFIFFERGGVITQKYCLVYKFYKKGVVEECFYVDITTNDLPTLKRDVYENKCQ